MQDAGKLEVDVAVAVGCWPAARSHRQKAAIVARFKGNNTRRPLFFSACVGMALVNNISARKNSRHEVGGPAQRLQAAVEQLTGEHSTPTLDFFRAISAGECLVVSTVALSMWRQAQLTDAHWAQWAVGLPLLKISAPRLLPYAMQSCAPSVCAARP